MVSCGGFSPKRGFSDPFCLFFQEPSVLFSCFFVETRPVLKGALLSSWSLEEFVASLTLRRVFFFYKRLVFFFLLFRHSVVPRWICDRLSFFFLFLRRRFGFRPPLFSDVDDIRSLFFSSGVGSRPYDSVGLGSFFPFLHLDLTTSAQRRVPFLFPSNGMRTMSPSPPFFFGEGAIFLWRVFLGLKMLRGWPCHFPFPFFAK